MHSEFEQYTVIFGEHFVEPFSIERHVALHYRATDKVATAVSIWEMYSAAFFIEWPVLAVMRRALCALRTAPAALLAIEILK